MNVVESDSSMTNDVSWSPLVSRRSLTIYDETHLRSGDICC